VSHRALPCSFYTRPSVLAVARDLLGRVLVVAGPAGQRTSGRIVETEAYRGPRDRASHAWDGRRTARNEAMYGVGGTAYVFFVYGMHYHVNVVTGVEGMPHAVLVRALEPLEGIEAMRRRRPGLPDRDLTSGPGKLCAALGIDRALDRADLLGDRIWIEPGDGPVPRSRVAVGPRVGVDYAGEWAARPWRFWIRDSPYVSRAGRLRRRGGRRGRPAAAQAIEPPSTR
jgi:DNA-3-methyladenine glycosylase